MEKMKVEVWSDIMCPYCYIGKRNYEAALQQFTENNNIELEIKSFQLDPTIQPSGKNENIYKYLAERKGINVEQSKKMINGVVQTAKNAGLDFDFEKSVVANSFDAHRLIQLAKDTQKDEMVEELLFRAYFTDGKDVADKATLIAIGNEVGLDDGTIDSAFNNPVYSEKVNFDINEAQMLGVRGVPFFVFDRKYAISGAQPPEAFLQTLQQSFQEWRKNHPGQELTVSEGAVCNIDGTCE